MGTPQELFEQYPLPVTIEATFEDEGAEITGEMAKHFGLSPDELAIYGLYVVYQLMCEEKSWERDGKVFIGRSKNDPALKTLETPRAFTEQL